MSPLPYGELGSTTDPCALVPGTVNNVLADAYDLRERADELTEQADGPVSARVNFWIGPSATRSTTNRTAIAQALTAVADLYRTVATVLEAHADVLAWAQARAQVAIELWARGVDLAASAGGSTLLLRPQATGPFARSPAFPESDPGAPWRRQAEAVLASARREVNASGQAAARILDEFSAGMPDGQFHIEEFLGGIGDWVTGIASLVWRFNAIRALIDHDGMLADAEEIRQGLWDTGAAITADPTQAVPLLFNTRLMHDNPGRWWGQLFPDIALTAAGGVGVLSKSGTFARIGDDLSDLAQRARALDWADDTGAIDLQTWLRRDPIDLTDGTQLLPATAEQQAAAAAQIDALPEGPILARGEPGAFQQAVYGPNERLIGLPDGSVASVDGVTSAYGTVVGDAKYVMSANGSIYIPESVSPSFAPIATRQMDQMLLRLADASDALQPGRPVEIVTNNLASANAWEARMRALGIPGYVRVQP